MSASIFATLLATDVKQFVEKKDKFSYLSWSYAVAELRKADPTATWEVLKFPLPEHAHVLAPYCITPSGCFVEVAVTVGGIRLSQVHPVLDQRNAAIKSPSADQVNKSIMRCLVKAIALHGLGLHIYAGEDLPLGDVDDADDKKKTPPPPPPEKKTPPPPAKTTTTLPPEKKTDSGDVVDIDEKNRIKAARLAIAEQAKRLGWVKSDGVVDGDVVAANVRSLSGGTTPETSIGWEDALAVIKELSPATKKSAA